LAERSENSAKEQAAKAEAARRDADSQRAAAIEKSNLALAAQLAAQADLAWLDRGAQPRARVAILALDSMRKARLFDNDRILRLALSELSPLVREVSLSSSLSSLTAGPDGPQLAPRSGLSALSPNLRFRAWADPDGTVRVVETEGKRQVALFPGKAPVSAVALSPTAAYVAVGGPGSGVTVFRTGSQTPYRLISLSRPVTSLAFSADEQSLAVGSTNSARIYALATGDPVCQIQFATRVSAMAFSPDGRELFTLAGLELRRHLLSAGDVMRTACAVLKKEAASEEWTRVCGDIR
jgi:WD40 repeat protein